MGDYQEVLGRKVSLRPLDEEKDRRNRRPLFGNPFRKQGAVDEADAMEGVNFGRRPPSVPSTPPSPMKRKRALEKPPPSPSPSKTQKMLSPSEAFEANNSTRLELYREVRRPLSCPSESPKLPGLLEQIAGDADVRRAMIRELIDQAKLFGSTHVLPILEEAISNIRE